MTVDEYSLCRDYQASVRLNLQHHQWVEAQGYLLHPSIPTTNSDLSVAEVGTGTGIWLLDLAHRLPHPPAQLTGLDISADQFPCPEWLPFIMRFIGDMDALDPAGLPTELVGKFDIVHMRLNLSIVRDNDPSPLLKYCHKLLKPGGYIQWDELDKDQCRVANDRGGSTEGMDRIWGMLKGPGEGNLDWVGQLPESYRQCGFEVVEVERKVSLPWQRGMIAETNFMLADEFMARAGRSGQGIPGAEGLGAQASRETRSGTYLDLILQITVGRKI